MREGKEAKAILCFCLAYIISKAWTLLPEDKTTHDYFPFHDFEVTLRFHVYTICGIGQMIALYCGLSFLFERFKTQIIVLLALYMLDLPDYLFIYQEALFYIGHWPIEFGLIKGIIIIFIGLKTYLQWKH